MSEKIYRELCGDEIITEKRFKDGTSLADSEWFLERRAQLIGVNFDRVQLIVDGRVYSEFEL